MPDPLLREAARERSGLPASVCVEWDVDFAPAEHALGEIVGGVANEMKYGHDVSSPVCLQLTFSPSMKASVRARASLSVNCCGGDFIK
jgi:hypothetical protein